MTTIFYLLTSLQKTQTKNIKECYHGQLLKKKNQPPHIKERSKEHPTRAK
uniref:Uncharacterized protein n=1 Tax=Arundo donax TaxID=35708 RepID=A0A0A9GPH3_ARUDO